jgi:ArsR family transcriptional regulator
VIPCRLAEGAANVTELVDFTGLPQAEVSKQLARLRAAGLVDAAGAGRARSYSLCQTRTARIMRVLHADFCGPVDDQPE